MGDGLTGAHSGVLWEGGEHLGQEVLALLGQLAGAGHSHDALARRDAAQIHILRDDDLRPIRDSYANHHLISQQARGSVNVSIHT